MCAGQSFGYDRFPHQCTELNGVEKEESGRPSGLAASCGLKVISFTRSSEKESIRTYSATQYIGIMANVVNNPDFLNKYLDRLT